MGLSTYSQGTFGPFYGQDKQTIQAGTLELRYLKVTEERCKIAMDRCVGLTWKT